MGAIKHYLNDLTCRCAPDNLFAQEAIEYAVGVGWVSPSLTDLEADAQLVMTHYDEILARYRQTVSRALGLLEQSYAPLLKAIEPPPKAA